VNGDGEQRSLRSRRAVTRLASAAILAVAGAQLAVAATISVQTERDGDSVEVRASAMLKADPAMAWRVLTDYDRYPEFIPDLRVSRVLARHGGKVTVEQSGSASLWVFKIPLDVTFEIDELPPNTVRSHAIAGNLRALVSSYELTPGPLGVRLDYAGRIAPGFEAFAQIEQITVEQSIARQFQSLADEIERRSAANSREETAQEH